MDIQNPIAQSWPTCQSSLTKGHTSIFGDRGQGSDRMQTNITTWVGGTRGLTGLGGEGLDRVVSGGHRVLIHRGGTVHGLPVSDCDRFKP